MTEELYHLQTFIDLLMRGEKFHICIQDISGILGCDALKVAERCVTHTKPWCDAAKTTSKGLNLCLKCKVLANRKAIKSQSLFTGHCPLGIREVVQPVVFNGSAMCIVYVGNLVDDEARLMKKTRHVCRLTGVDIKRFNSLTDTLCCIEDISFYTTVARLVAGYILMIYGHIDFPLNTGRHWAVDTLKSHVYAYYNRDITLSGMAEFVGLNVDYLGQLFKRDMHIEFSKFLNIYRINKACEMLKGTKQPVIDIAMGVGFNHVTYFNRMFKRIVGVSPSEYRRRDTPMFVHPVLIPPEAGEPPEF